MQFQFNFDSKNIMIFYTISIYCNFNVDLKRQFTCEFQAISNLEYTATYALRIHSLHMHLEYLAYICT